MHLRCMIENWTCKCQMIVTVVQHICWFFKASNSPMFFHINYFNLILDCFPFTSIYDPPYQIFQFPFVLHVFDVLLALLLVGRMSRLRILYHNYKRLSTQQFLVMFNSVGGLTRKRYLPRVEPLVNIILMSHGLHIFWIFSAWLLT